ncbi:MAG: nucleotidyl transferase AbiEii/AbiGii toxin family protein [Candidatus Binatia bacterium]
MAAGTDPHSWETLFRHAMEIIDAALAVAGPSLARWTFGGGTALMLTHRHRVSKDVDLFFDDPQVLSFLSPRLNGVAESKTGACDEQTNYLKLYFPEGEIDFIVSCALTPSRSLEVLGRLIQIENDAEILAKKLAYRGSSMKARDILDIACVLERSPSVASILRPFYSRHRDAIESRLRDRESVLREDFVQLDIWEYKRGFDSCVEIMRRELA